MSELTTPRSIGSILQAVTGPLKQGKCDRHGPFNSPDGVTCPLCAIERDTAQAQAQAANARKQAALRTMVYHSGIPPRFRAKTFDGFDPADEKQARVLRICRAYAQRFDERYAAGGGLVMCGPPGTGKTHLACAIGNALLEAGRSAVFMSVLAAIDRVKETFRAGGQTKKQAMAAFFDVDLLILDEVGVQYGSEAEKVILYEIINGRYERVLPTILISNLAEAELDAYTGARVMDRMREGGGVVLAFDWESRRSQIKTASRDMPPWVNADAS